MKNETSNYKLVLGLEIHLHINTEKKMFCGCSAHIHDAAPNTHTCPVCLGLPGALPVPNYDAVKKTQLLGLATNCTLNQNSKFDRKHYFYPDLSKGYQISQYEEPLCENGYIELSNGEKALIARIHLEEDTAKSVHENGETLLDFNMAGMPLVEIVTEPCFTDVKDAVEFSKKIQDLVKHIGIGDVNMEKGQMRLEANISLRTPEMERNDDLPNYKVEVKNINSFRFMEKAVLYEIERQSELLLNGEKVIQENRGWDDHKGVTKSQRSKEEAHDYRYFPEPDIPPMAFDEAHIEELRSILPELPDEIRKRLIMQYEISENNAEYLSVYPGLALLEKFEEICTHNIEPNKVANLLLNKQDYKELTVDEFVKRYEDEAQKVDDAGELSQHVEKVLAENPDAVEKIKSGKEAVYKFLIGMVMRETKGKADAETVENLLREKLR